jgi:NitT/TauT family transport system substrate-binding protein
MRRIASPRRRFLGLAAGLGLAAALGDPRLTRAEPEVRRLRLVHAPAMCLAPQYLAEDLLQAEGFEKSSTFR